MDPRFLTYYNRELQHVREMGAEFARAYPKIAGRLGLDGFECTDPYVERLLESFAFMAARVHLRLDAEFPRFSQHLLEIVYPHYLAPTPSMVMAEFRPNLREGALAGGFVVPRGSMLRGRTGKDQLTACEYRTAHDTVLWPLELGGAEYTTYRGELGSFPAPVGRVPRAVLRLRLHATAGFKFSQLAIDTLPIFLQGNDEIAYALYEQVLANVIAVVVHMGAGAPPAIMTDDPVVPGGFDDDSALLPFGPRSFQGYRLLQEYFAFPQRFLFFQLSGLKDTLCRSATTEAQIDLILDRRDSRLEARIDATPFRLFCTPAINIFPRRVDRIHLSDREHEYHVVPDRTRPMDFEVCAVTEVVGYGASSSEKQDFLPLYAASDRGGHGARPAYYTTVRRPRALSAKQREQGTRSSYVGSEVFLSLVDANEAPYRTGLKQLAVETLCTNRDLPLHMTVGQGTTDFTLGSGAPVESVRCVAGPTPPRASHAHGDVSWRLISHMALNHLSLINQDGQGPAALREMLMLYCDPADLGARRQIEGLKSIESNGITRRLPIEGPLAFGRGLQVDLAMDETAFEGGSAFLLGSVLDRFFAKYVSLNSFTETILRTTQRGEIKRWPVRLGTRPTI
jgi:type VI secretion system protein ImpG